MCGKNYQLPDGKTAECNPDGDAPCCDGWVCGNSTKSCTGTESIDYRKVRDWREAGNFSAGNEVDLAELEVSMFEMSVTLKFRRMQIKILPSSALLATPFSAPVVKSAKHQLANGTVVEPLCHCCATTLCHCCVTVASLMRHAVESP